MSNNINIHNNNINNDNKNNNKNYYLNNYNKNHYYLVNIKYIIYRTLHKLQKVHDVICCSIVKISL